MVKTRHSKGMEGFILLALFILVGPLALLFGADSRVDDARGWWPGTPRMAASSSSRERQAPHGVTRAIVSTKQAGYTSAARRRFWLVSLLRPEAPCVPFHPGRAEVGGEAHLSCAHDHPLLTPHSRSH
jgi:hypothetical protein